MNLFVPDEDFLDLNEAEQKLRQLREENPEEFERIANLRDGIRSSYSTDTKGLYVFCQSGRYQQLFLVNNKGKIESRDIDNILGVIQCGPALPAGKLPTGYNETVMKIKSQFAEEVKRRVAERDYTRSLTSGQRYVLRELRIAFGATEDEDKRRQISVLEQAFRSFVTVAVNRELNLLRRNGVSGTPLITNLIRIYNQHNMDQISLRIRENRLKEEIPRIICSEALV